MIELDRRNVLRGGLATAALAATGVSRVPLAQSATFAFEAQMIGHNPADQTLAAFANGQIDRYARVGPNSLAGGVRIATRNRSGLYRLYPG